MELRGGETDVKSFSKSLWMEDVMGSRYCKCPTGYRCAGKSLDATQPVGESAVFLEDWVIVSIDLCQKHQT
eukprot:scaffold437_cov111-Cylindrotheca_fusiformis.AAC.15